MVVPHLSDRSVKAGELKRAKVNTYTIVAVYGEDTSIYKLHCDENITDTAIENGRLRTANMKNLGNSYMVCYVNYKGRIVTEDNKGNNVKLLRGETEGTTPASCIYEYNEQGLLSYATETNKSNTQHVSYLYNEEERLYLIRNSRRPLEEDSLGLLLKYDKMGRVSSISHYSRVIAPLDTTIPKKGIRDIFSKALGRNIVTDSIGYKYNSRGYIKEVVFSLNDFKKVEVKRYYYNSRGLVKKLDEDYRVFYYTYTYRK